MYDDGYTSIVNIDISKIVIDQMTDRHRDKAGLTCKWPWVLPPPPPRHVLVWCAGRISQG